MILRFIGIISFAVKILNNLIFIDAAMKFVVVAVIENFFVIFRTALLIKWNTSKVVLHVKQWNYNMNRNNM